MIKKINILIFILVFFIIGIFCMILRFNSKNQSDASNEIKNVSELILILDKQNNLIQSNTNDLLIVKFINPNCSICLNEMKEIISLSNEYKSINFLFIYPDSKIMKYDLESKNNIYFHCIDIETYKKVGIAKKPTIYIFKNLMFKMKIDGYLKIKSILPKLK